MATIKTSAAASTLVERELYKYSDATKTAMLEAGAAVLVRAQRDEAERQGLRDTGLLIEGIEAETPKLTEDGGSVVIATNRKYPGRKTRTAEVAAVYEYGSPRHAARPFVRPANDKASAEVASAMDAARKAAER